MVNEEVRWNETESQGDVDLVLLSTLDFGRTTDASLIVDLELNLALERRWN